MYMGRSFEESQRKEREGIYMISDQISGDRIAHRARLAQAIGSDIDPDILRIALKYWDERRTGMRESLSGDLRK